MMHHLKPISFDQVQGFNSCTLQHQWSAFIEWCQFYLKNNPNLRPAHEWPAYFKIIAHAACALHHPNNDAIREFLKTYYNIFEITSETSDKVGFLTGYYQPILHGSLQPNDQFTCPIFARPDDLISFTDGYCEDLPGLYAGRRDDQQRLIPYQTRQEIELDKSSKYKALIWVRDYVEAFLLNVQGSALIITDEGTEYKLTYAGRNGHPYTSIGKILIEGGYINQNEMSLDHLKDCLRSHGQGPDDHGRAIMWQNKSFIFFKLEKITNQDKRPIGGAGLGLNPLISVATDRSYWPYGTLFWLEANIPYRHNHDELFSSLVISQDTGTAIVGQTRFDLYMGSGEFAGISAGQIRHHGRVYVLQVNENAIGK